MENSENILVYNGQTIGHSESFNSSVSIIGHEILECKDSRKFHELMYQIKVECSKLGIHFKGYVYGSESTIKYSHFQRLCPECEKELKGNTNYFLFQDKPQVKAICPKCGMCFSSY